MCATVVSKALKKVEGVVNAEVNFATEKAVVEFVPGKVDIEKLKKAIENAGYKYLGTEERTQEKVDRFHVYRVITGFTIGIILMFLGFIHVYELFEARLVAFGMAIPGFLFVSLPILTGAFRSLKNFTLSMEVMYTIGISVCFIAGVLATFGILAIEFMLFDSALLLAAFLMLGRILEQRAKASTTKSLKKLLTLQPKKANVLREGVEVEENVEFLKPGDIVVVRAGERIPSDGTVLEGWCYIDESMLTGESFPRLKKEGMKVIGGTIARKGTIKVRIEKVGAETVLAHIIQLVSEAMNSKPRIQKVADKVVKFFIPLVLFIGITTFLFWYFLMHESFLFSLSVLIAVLAVACPCALGLATPAAITVGIGKGAELGIFIKDAYTFEIGEKVSTVVFDKTGTLTSGKPKVLKFYNKPEFDRKFILKLVTTVESKSMHPLAEAIVEYSKENFYAKIEDFEEFEGRGIRAIVEGTEVILGSEKMLENFEIKIDQDFQKIIRNVGEKGQSTVFVALDRKLAGIFIIGDEIRIDTKDVVEKLKEDGIKTAIVTGDNEKSATHIAKILGIDKIFANVMPDKKAEIVKMLARNGEIVCFVGDGVNDAPALASAHLGIAMGRGTDVAIESGDIVLVNDRIRDVYTFLRLSRKVMSRVRQNIFWAFAYNFALIPVAAGALHPIGITIKPELAALAMALSSVSVLLLSLSLKRFR